MASTWLTVFRASLRSRATRRIDSPAPAADDLIALCSVMGIQLRDQVLGENGHTGGITGHSAEVGCEQQPIAGGQAGPALSSQPALHVAQALHDGDQTARCGCPPCSVEGPRLGPPLPEIA